MTSVAELEKELRCVIVPEDEGRMVKHIASVRMGLSNKQFRSAKFREDGVLLDGIRAIATDTVHAGQTLTVRLREPGSPYTPSHGEVPIVYEDDDILIINKPAPLPTQSSERQTGDTLEARLLERLGGRAFRPVNRLDKGTSGLMAAAKHPQAQAILQKQLHSDQLVREYLAILCGAPQSERGTVDAPIGKADGATVRREVRPDGKEARTHYRVLYCEGGLSLVRLRLETGRTHQIRVHMASIGHPLLGDGVYGAKSPEKGLEGQCLHASHLQFIHPDTREKVELCVPLPDYFREVLSKLGNKTK